MSDPMILGFVNAVVVFADIGVSDAAVWVAAISALAAVVTSLINNRKLGDMHTQFNHRVDELVEAAELRGMHQEKARRLAVDEGTAMITANQIGQVLAWSPGAVVLFGWNPEEALGKDLRDLIIPEELQGIHQQAMLAAAAAGRLPRTEPLIFNAHDKTGNKFLVEVTLSGVKTGDAWFYSARLSKRAEKFTVVDGKEAK